MIADASVQNPVHTDLIVVEQSDALLVSQSFALTSIGLRVIGTPDFSECEGMFNSLCQFSGVINLAIGDLLNYAEMTYGETYAQLEAAWHKQVEQLYNFKWVSQRVPYAWREQFSSINENHRLPSYSLCKAAASIADDDARRDLIARAAVNDWHSPQVSAEARRLNGQPSVSPLQAAIGRVYAALDFIEANTSGKAKDSIVYLRIEAERVLGRLSA